MNLGVQVIGALIITYLVSRLTLQIVSDRVISGPMRYGAAHALSWLLIALVVGYVKAFLDFSFGAGLIYLGPQLFWALLDTVRRTRGL